ncbi:MAG TPA: SH3 domain-containing protein [Vicinamibacterales bacterium]|nr:SH3 domain-containing protein [Vicinamibacterales bacterium]
MRTFIALALAAVVGLRAAGEQPPATDNPCAGNGNRNPRLLPVDEADSRPEFFRYRVRLQMAVEQRDVAAVIEAADPGIRLGFDAPSGGATLHKLFSDRPELWDELRVVLARGGRFSSPSSFAAPYVYASWPDQFDAFECAAVIGSNVRLRSAPRLDASIVAPVSYPIVRLMEPVPGRLWSRVRLGDGRAGYMWHAYVRSSVDYRALFNLIDGRWRMTAFVAGD